MLLRCWLIDTQLIQEHMVRKFTHSANLLLYDFNSVNVHTSIESKFSSCCSKFFKQIPGNEVTLQNK